MALAVRNPVFACTEHPVIRTHPEMGRPSPYVSPTSTERTVDRDPNEGEALLAMLHERARRPDFSCRVSREPGQATTGDGRE